MSLFCNFQDAPTLIKDKLLLSTVVEEHGVTLKRQGKEWVGLCPFHEEKTPSFSVNDSKGVYLCRGCSAHGDVITFVSETTGQSPGQVIRSLVKRLGYQITPSEEWKNGRASRNRPILRTDDRDLLTGFHNYVAQMAHRNLVALLRREPGSPVVRYVRHERCYSEDVILQYGLGYLPSQADLYDLARTPHPLNPEPTELNRQHWEALAVETGLLKNGHSRSMFQGRLLFPITNSSGSCVAFSARVIPGAEEDAILPDRKYLNSPSTLIFDKSTALFGMVPWSEVLGDTALRQAWRTRLNASVVLIVEGLTDAIRLAERGIHAVAAMGTGITKNHLRTIFRQFNHVQVVTDGDDAGISAAKRTLIEGIPLLKPGTRFCAIALPQGEDPDTFFEVASDSDAVQNMLALLPKLHVEDVWYQQFIAPVCDPLTLADQVTIEQALSGKHDAPMPEDPDWRLAFHRFVADKTGYVTRPYCHTRGIGLPRPLHHTLIQGDVAVFWLYRVSRYPALLACLSRWDNRWWVRDALNGLLADPIEVPPTLRVLFHTRASLSENSIDPKGLNSWSDLAHHLIEAGFPSSLLVHWSEIARDTDRSLEKLGYAQELFAPDLWEYELTSWVEELDTRLTSRLHQAVSAT